MKAHLIDTHLLVPRSRSSAKVKVKYRSHVSQKMGVSRALVFLKHIVFFLNFFISLIFFYFFPLTDDKILVQSELKALASYLYFLNFFKNLENLAEKEENTDYQHVLLCSQGFQNAFSLQSSKPAGLCGK